MHDNAIQLASFCRNWFKSKVKTPTWVLEEWDTNLGIPGRQMGEIGKNLAKIGRVSSQRARASSLLAGFGKPKEENKPKPIWMGSPKTCHPQAEHSQKTDFHFQPLSSPRKKLRPAKTPSLARASRWMCFDTCAPPVPQSPKAKQKSHHGAGVGHRFVARLQVGTPHKDATFLLESLSKTQKQTRAANSKKT